MPQESNPQTRRIRRDVQRDDKEGLNLLRLKDAAQVRVRNIPYERDKRFLLLKGGEDIGIRFQRHVLQQLIADFRRMPSAHHSNFWL